MTNPEIQKRLGSMVTKAEMKYGKNSAEAALARRVAESTGQVLAHTGSNLDFLGEGQFTRIQTMERSQAACEGYVEHYCTVTNPLLRPLHMTIAASREAQKVAHDALHRLASWFTSEPDGAGPLGETHAYYDLDPATAVTVYATSRPGERWLLDLPYDDFERITDLLRFDGHCDFADPSFATNLDKYRLGSRGTDCVKQMKEHSELHQRCLRDRIIRPDPDFHVGEFVPVAFGNQMIFLKFCVGHLYAFYRKYQIVPDECEIFGPWETIGNQW
ncbi:MAG TPA: hypothetical protein VME67_16605 [Mycobacterium sp.]|nr:hypothetical protein [Mycobacterium sp.]HTX96333.1 hypothetical protein [Mycobacterium sp.]